jgi:acyl-CoA reductase-like NAD-dependent aldehyde dehydrogenase
MLGRRALRIFSSKNSRICLTSFSCVSANRIFAQSGIYDKFAQAMVERIKKQKVGLGTDEGVTVGPLTHERAVEKAVRHIKGHSKLLSNL